MTGGKNVEHSIGDRAGPADAVLPARRSGGYHPDMSRSGSEYHIGRPTGVCAATGRVLEPSTTYVATLCEHPEDEGFDRLDYSDDAWESGTRPERLFSYWRATVPEPDEKRRIFVDDAVLLQLFEQLDGDERPQRIAFRFVLALILMRKRLLRYIGRDPSCEHERWLMMPRGVKPPTPPITVTNPQLSDDDIRDLTDQLSAVLQGEL